MNDHLERYRALGNCLNSIKDRLTSMERLRLQARDKIDETIIFMKESLPNLKNEIKELEYLRDEI